MRWEAAVYCNCLLSVSVLSPLSPTNTLLAAECWLMFMEPCESIIRRAERGRDDKSCGEC